MHPIHTLPFEWHDLTVERIAITEKGVVVDVLPYNNDAGRYDHATLSLHDADAIEFDVQGKLSLKDLESLEIKDFDIVNSTPGRITGSLGILCGEAGYWTIQVTNAIWHVEQRDPVVDQSPNDM